jgi:hypothetical protein
MVPFVRTKLGNVGKAIVAVMNGATEEARTRVERMVAPTPVETPVAKKASFAATPEFAPHIGFRSFAHEGKLTIDDIVKGLARSKTIDEETYISEELPAIHEEIHASTQTQSVAEEVTSEETVPNVVSFVTALLHGDKERVFDTIRSLVKEGKRPDEFLTNVVCTLDDAYRARLDGTHCDEAVVHACAPYETNTLERVIGALTTAVDTSYQEAHTGVKLALTRALAVVG